MNTTITANSRTKGFTLLELMIVVALVAIIATMGYPSFTELIVSQRVRAAASALYDSLLLARSEAVKRNTAVSMSVTNLKDGWTIVTSDSTLLRTQEPFASLEFSPTNPSIAYNGFGRLSSGAGAKITVTSPSSSKSRCITIDTVGRPRVAEGICT
ncbi:MAG: GspH/FimT family pseudopilin [Pseudomonadota bacterium]|nr:GspH/FimT family pseudopilin [Gammaproteobacteria bacterium]MDQ3580242.1 GspH/FimT family pseudopilin [Pseudomonadota bacterium]